MAQQPRSMARREAANGPVPADSSTRINAPRGLVAWRVDVPGGAFALLEWPAPSARTAELWSRLTCAEAEVGHGLIAALSNAEIATRRGCSPRTIANQVASIFRKIGVTSRLEFHALMARSEPPASSGSRA
jgi:DNA-binding CsgD family transcriptional regulator